MRRNKCVLDFSVLFFALLLAIGAGGSLHLKAGIAEAKITGQTALPDDRLNDVIGTDNPHVRAVMDVQNRHNPEFLRIPEVVGTATGLTDGGEPAILIFLKKTVRADLIPEIVEGVRVVARITGEIRAMRGGSKNTGIFPLPVPIGVSTGNEGECSAGTIGARVKDSTGNVYALSNNHVYALENNARIGSSILQPGLYDTNCVVNGSNVIGTLFQFESINFNGGNNTVDAAIALSSTELLGKATPSGGYGTPNSTTVNALLNQPVQKYGRTSSLTRGTVSGINATVIVDYGSAGKATFVDQITISSSKPFIKSGDSGSLLVTDSAAANPVGLLFAGSATGKLAVANQIDNVLGSFGVTMDGK